MVFVRNDSTTMRTPAKRLRTVRSALATERARHVAQDDRNPMNDHRTPPPSAPSMATAPEEYLRRFEARMASMRANADRLQEGLQATNATATSEEGEVTVTVNLSGALQSIEFGPTHRHLSGQGLSNLIMETYGEAAAEASSRTADVMSDILGDDSEALSIMRRYAPGGDG